MKLARLALVGMIVSGAGLMAVLLVMVFTLDQLDQDRGELASLSHLQDLVDDLSLPAESLFLSQVRADLDRFFDEERGRIRGTVVLAGGALVFGLMCFLVFWLINQRVAARVSHLAERVRLVRGGNLNARAQLAGGDELAELADSFNELLDEQQRTLDALQQRENELARYQTMLEESQQIAGIGSWRYYLKEQRLEWSAETFRILGEQPFSFVPTLEYAQSRIHPDDRERVVRQRESVIKQGLCYESVFRMSTAKGEERWLRETGGTSFDARAGGSHLSGTVQDVTEREGLVAQLQSVNAELHENYALRRLLIDSLPAHIAMLDGEGSIIDVNEQWCRFGREHGNADPDFGVGLNYFAVCEKARGIGAEEAQTIAQGLRQVLNGERDEFSWEYPCQVPGEALWFRVSGRPMHMGARSGQRRGMVVMHVDITERKRAEQRIEYLAFHDELTGLYSRAGLEDALKRLEQAGGPEAGTALLMLDIANFHEINDSFGSRAGDQILRSVAARLGGITPGPQLLARLGSDEFAVLMAPVGDGSLDLRATLTGIFSRPFFIEGDHTVRCSAEFGLFRVTGPEPVSVADMLQYAELALFQSRRSPDLRSWTEFSPSYHEEVETRIETTNALHEAVENEEFELHFQPKVDLVSGGLVACEALLRWEHPRRGLLPPGEFIPLAEQSQLIIPIGTWVLRETCRWLCRWRAAGMETVPVSVNVSTVQLLYSEFTTELVSIIKETGVDPGMLVLEITENIFARNTSRIKMVTEELHALGVSLSLDDFGTGYSSLQYLKYYPFDEVKIDRCFVADLLEDRYSESIVRNVVAIAQAIGADVVAEGIESAEQGARLRELGCLKGQGYFYSMPLETEDFGWLLERRGSLPVKVDD